MGHADFSEGVNLEVFPTRPRPRRKSEVSEVE